MTESETRPLRAWWLLLPVALLFACTVVVPAVLLLVTSFSSFEGGVTMPAFSLESYRETFTDGVTLKVFGDTVVLSLWITGAALLIGYPCALLMRRAGPRLRAVLMFMLVSPLLTSIIVRNLAWLLILGRNGIINATLLEHDLIERPLPLMYNNFGVIVAVVHVYLPFAVLPLHSSLHAIDRRIESAAASLGASPLRVFLNVTLPLSLPGISAAATLVFILSMGLYLTPVIMGGNFVNTLSMLITHAAREQYNWPLASAMATLLLASILIAVALPPLLMMLLRGRRRG